MMTRTLPSKIRPENHVHADASSPVCLNLIKGWYDDCVANHGPCSDPGSPTVPTRLIAVEGGEVDWKTRLVELPDIGVRYAALSHRWNSDVLKTTTNNLASMFEDIPRSSLSRTFQDAVVICKYLGISYLWVDSICKQP
jgi:hypothetical protein